MHLNMDHISYAQQQWNSLYVNSADAIWKEEIPSLKNAKMLIHILDLEFAKIKNNIHSTFDYYAKEQRSGISNIADEANLFPVPNTNPRNFITSTAISAKTSKQFQINASPDLFRDEVSHFIKNPIRKDQINKLHADINQIPIITDVLNDSTSLDVADDKNSQIFHSPTITKSRKYCHRKKKPFSSPCRRSLDKECFDSPNKRSKYVPLGISSPTILIPPDAKDVDSSNTLLDKIKDSTPNKKICATPIKINNETADESTIIDVTPEHKEFSKNSTNLRKLKKGFSKCKQKDKFKNVQGNRTLTQMYDSVPSASSVSINSKSEILVDDILDNIKEEKSQGKAYNNNINSLEVDDTYVPSIIDENIKIDEMIEDMNKDMKKGPLYGFIKNYDKVPDKIENKYVRGQVVRGKDRMSNLNAYDCPECKKFYELLPDGRKFMKECSKHRRIDDEIHHELSDCFRLDFTVRDINDSTDSTILDY